MNVLINIESTQPNFEPAWSEFLAKQKQAVCRDAHVLLEEDITRVLALAYISKFITAEQFIALNWAFSPNNLNNKLTEDKYSFDFSIPKLNFDPAALLDQIIP